MITVGINIPGSIHDDYAAFGHSNLSGIFLAVQGSTVKIQSHSYQIFPDCSIGFISINIDLLPCCKQVAGFVFPALQNGIFFIEVLRRY